MRTRGNPLLLTLLCAAALGGLAPEARAEEPMAEKVAGLAGEFLANLRAGKIDALARSSGLPWYNGGEIVTKEDDLRAALRAMAKWYDEQKAADYQILAIGEYRKLKRDPSTDLGPNDIKKMDKFLAGGDWLVVLGQVVGGKKKPRLYLLVKDRKGKLTVVGAHK